MTQFPFDVGPSQSSAVLDVSLNVTELDSDHKRHFPADRGGRRRRRTRDLFSARLNMTLTRSASEGLRSPTLARASGKTFDHQHGWTN